jgi:hypothetical protein
VRFLLEKTAFRVESAAFSIILHIFAVILVYILLLRLTRAVERDDVVWEKGLFSSPKKIAQIEQ